MFIYSLIRDNRKLFFLIAFSIKRIALTSTKTRTKARIPTITKFRLISIRILLKQPYNKIVNKYFYDQLIVIFQIYVCINQTISFININLCCTIEFFFNTTRIRNIRLSRPNISIKPIAVFINTTTMKLKLIYRRK